MRFLLSLLFARACSGATEKPPSIVLIVADDLGWNDLGAYNGQKTETPHIENLVRGGVTLTDYYTFKVCSPSRAAMLTGRYPWGAGFYDMSNDIMHCTANFTALPSMLKDLGYKTHALGKWDVGFMQKDCAPIARGFDTFFGYYDACQADYWYHGASGGYPVGKEGCLTDSGPTDFTNSTHREECAPAAGLNGTYNRNLFSGEAARLIRAHDQSKPMYMYLAFMNVHDGCVVSPGVTVKLGLQAPKGTVDMYANTKEDTYKVAGAMITELDFGVGEVVQALKEASMWDSTFVIIVSDNGGPLDHATNAPLRGGKHTFWEGGVRVRAIVGGSPFVIPKARQGSEWSGMAHSSDWYHTLVEGVAGGRVPDDTGPRPSDGFNLWTALLRGEASPRTEVVHQVSNAFFDESFVGIRMHDMKLMVGNPGDARWIAWPEPEASVVPLGLTGAVIEPGTDHVRAPGLAISFPDHLSPGEQMVAGDILMSPSGKVIFRMQYNGQLALITKDKHLLWSSGRDEKTPNQPGAFATFQVDGNLVLRGNLSSGQPVLWSSQSRQGAKRLEVREDCDVAIVGEDNNTLWSFNTSCPPLQSAGSLCQPYCLFNLTADVAEENDLALAQDATEKAKWDALAQKMRKRLDFHGATGGPHAFLYDAKTFNEKKTELCAMSVHTGFNEPLDCEGTLV